MLSTEILSSSSIEIHYVRPLFETMLYVTQAHDVVQAVKRISNSKQLDFKEFFWLLLLNHANRVLSIVQISSGTIHCVPVNTREIIQLALLKNASAIIIMHNHPSGSLSFSTPDVELTKRLQKMCKLFEINLLDHIVMSSEDYHSMAQKGLI